MMHKFWTFFYATDVFETLEVRKKLMNSKYMPCWNIEDETKKIDTCENIV